MGKAGHAGHNAGASVIARRKMAVADWNSGTRSLTILAARYSLDDGKLGDWMYSHGHATAEELNPWCYLINKDVSAETSDWLIPTDQYNG